jgi:formyl transferase-like protein
VTRKEASALPCSTSGGGEHHDRIARIRTPRPYGLYAPPPSHRWRPALRLIEHFLVCRNRRGALATRARSTALYEPACVLLRQQHPQEFPALVLGAGESETGVSIHLVNEEHDAGPVTAQCRVAVKPQDTANDLASRVSTRGRRMVIETLARLIAQSADPRAYICSNLHRSLSSLARRQ